MGLDDASKNDGAGTPPPAPAIFLEVLCMADVWFAIAGRAEINFSQYLIARVRAAVIPPWILPDN